MGNGYVNFGFGRKVGWGVEPGNLGTLKDGTVGLTLGGHKSHAEGGIGLEVAFMIAQSPTGSREHSVTSNKRGAWQTKHAEFCMRRSQV